LRCEGLLVLLLGMVCNVPNGGISDIGIVLIPPEWVIGWDAREEVGN